MPPAPVRLIDWLWGLQATFNSPECFQEIVLLYVSRFLRLSALMGRVGSNRRLATALLKTLKRLESDTSVDQNEPAFIHLKCEILQRLLNLELDAAEHQSRIHAVETWPKFCVVEIFEPPSSEAGDEKAAIA